MKFLGKISVVAVLFTLVIGLSGCGKTDPQKSYASILSTLANDQEKAFVDMGKNKTPVLLVTKDTFKYDSQTNAALDAKVYFSWDGKSQELGDLEAQGTAYPIRAGEGKLYVSGPHSIAIYTIDQSAKKLVRSEYAEEKFDTKGNATYYYAKDDGKKEKVKDDSNLTRLFDESSNVDVVNFKE